MRVLTTVLLFITSTAAIAQSKFPVLSTNFDDNINRQFFAAWESNKDQIRSKLADEVKQAKDHNTPLNRLFEGFNRTGAQILEQRYKIALKFDSTMTALDKAMVYYELLLKPRMANARPSIPVMPQLTHVNYTASQAVLENRKALFGESVAGQFNQTSPLKSKQTIELKRNNNGEDAVDARYQGLINQAQAFGNFNLDIGAPQGQAFKIAFEEGKDAKPFIVVKNSDQTLLKIELSNTDELKAYRLAKLDQNLKVDGWMDATGSGAALTLTRDSLILRTSNSPLQGNGKPVFVLSDEYKHLGYNSVDEIPAALLSRDPRKAAIFISVSDPTSVQKLLNKMNPAQPRSASIELKPTLDKLLVGPRLSLEHCSDG